MLFVDDKLQMVTGYGDFDDIQERNFGRFNSELEYPSERIGNWNWIQYGNELNQK